MVKAKRRQLAALAVAEDYNLHGLVESSNFRAEEDMHEDDDWVIVKKQRITIWIPPPPPSMQPTTILGPPRTNKRQPKSKKIVRRRRQTKMFNERQHPRQRSHNVDLQNSNAVLTSKTESRHGKNLESSSNSMKFTKHVSRRNIAPKGLTRSVEDEVYLPATSKTQIHECMLPDAAVSMQAIMLSRGLRADISKNRLPTTTFPPPAIYRSRGPTRTFVKSIRSINCLNMGLGVLQQNQKMRASNLERKLEKAGGLSRWLMSLGLGQFVQMFRLRNLNDKFQLLNLTMGKLKDMGAIAVGPRRKLMHAIDCLSFQGCTLRRGVIEKKVIRE